MLRQARLDDLDAMRQWRNHEEVRGVSLTQHVITAEEHLSWWKRIENDPGTVVLIYERDAVPSGVVTFFDIDGATAWWGYYLDNAGLTERGALFPAWISVQREAVRYAKNELLLMEVHGETMVSNEAAVSFNQRQGFEEVERVIREIAGAQVEVIHSRKIFELENHA